jgi:predicted RNA-binding protein
MDLLGERKNIMGKIKIPYQELLDNGFTKHGNWYIRGNVSVNLLSQTLLHSGKPSFYIEIDEVEPREDITLKDVMALSDIMAKLTGY